MSMRKLKIALVAGLLSCGVGDPEPPESFGMRCNDNPSACEDQLVCRELSDPEMIGVVGGMICTMACRQDEDCPTLRAHAPACSGYADKNETWKVPCIEGFCAPRSHG